MKIIIFADKYGKLIKNTDIMKKLLTLFAAMLFSAAMFAQLGQPRWSVNVGLGTQTIIGSDTKYFFDDDSKVTPNFAWQVGTEVRIPLMGTEFGAQWLADVAIGTRGFHHTWKSGNKYETKEALHTFNLQIAPFMFGWNFDLGPVSLMPFAGPYLSIDFAGANHVKSKWDDGEAIDVKQSIWKVLGEKEMAASDSKAYLNYYDEDAKKWKRGHQFFDVGLNFGGNVYFLDHFYGGVMFQTGFMQMAKKSYREFTDEDGKKVTPKFGTSFSFLVRFGYEF